MNKNLGYYSSLSGDFVHNHSYLLDLINTLPTKSKILDVGCGSGDLIKDILRIRPDLIVYGVDLSDVSTFFKNTSIKFIKSSGDFLPFKKDYFDLILSINVLEHVLNPLDFFLEWKRCLKIGGIIYLRVPHINCLNYPDIIDKPSNFYGDYTHIHPYTFRSLNRLILDSELKYMKIDYDQTKKGFLDYIKLLKFFIFGKLFFDKYNLLKYFAFRYPGGVVSICKKINE